GITLLSGAHNTLLVKILDLLSAKGVTDIVLFGGGIIPSEDVEFLKEKGVRELFTPGASLEEIVDFVKGIRHG
ncbi:MAG: methylmalonyl-CoA mutase, partial [Nitrospirota bacterium]